MESPNMSASLTPSNLLEIIRLQRENEYLRQLTFKMTEENAQIQGRLAKINGILVAELEESVSLEKEKKKLKKEVNKLDKYALKWKYLKQGNYYLEEKNRRLGKKILKLEDARNLKKEEDDGEEETGEDNKREGEVEADEKQEETKELEKNEETEENTDGLMTLNDIKIDILTYVAIVSCYIIIVFIYSVFAIR